MGKIIEIYNKSPIVDKYIIKDLGKYSISHKSTQFLINHYLSAGSEHLLDIYPSILPWVGLTLEVSGEKTQEFSIIKTLSSVFEKVLDASVRLC